MSLIPTEVVATFTHDGATYQIDHLGIAVDSLWGEFVVYRGDVQVAGFPTDAAGRPENRPDLPETDTLIGLAIQAVTLARRSDRNVDRVCPRQGGSTVSTPATAVPDCTCGRPFVWHVFQASTLQPVGHDYTLPDGVVAATEASGYTTAPEPVRVK
jgi:hypothetical protein